jgi:spore coat protein A
MKPNVVTHGVSLLAFCLLGLIETQAQAAEVTISPSQDNTIAQGTDPGSGEDYEDNSSGACDQLFSGITNDGLLRRLLVQFDIAGSVPAGSTITGVTLTMTVNRSGDNQDRTMGIYPVSLAWGEGTNGCGPRGGGQGEPAVAGAATWLDAEFGITSWTSAGGDIGAVSATALVGSANGSIATWSNGAMVAEVQGWLDGTTPNAGWLVKLTQEVFPPVSTARRFNSREGGVPPALTVTFVPPEGSVACCFGDGTCSVELSTLACSDAGGDPADPATDTCVDPVDNTNPCPQPTGACCNLDQTCSDDVERDVCEGAGGVFQGANNTCNQGNVDCGLTPFVDALPIPPPLQPTGQRADGVLQYTVSVETATQSAHSELPNTDLWTYNGAWPAATIVAQKDIPIEVRYENNLPARGNRGGHILEVDECAHGPNYFSDAPLISTHLHGGHVPARVDGQPEYTILPGEIDTYEYPNNQDAATMWYHDHALGITRLNVYSGMAGFYLLADDEDTLDATNAFGLPSGDYEIGMAIQDRQFNDDGSLFYNPTITNAFKGDVVTVNGKVWPFLNVDRGQYRFRMLNGSQSREYMLRLENITNPGNEPDIWLVGTDLGLVTVPINLGSSIGGIMTGAERFDVVVDFSSNGVVAGDEIVLRNDDLTTPLIPNIMKFVVTSNPGYTGFDTGSSLRTVAPLDSTGVLIRHFWLTKEDKPCANQPGRIIGEWLIKSLDGPPEFDPATGELVNVLGQQWDDLTDFPVLGTREIWEFHNPTNSPHPMHVHLVKFQVLKKTDLAGNCIPLEPWEGVTDPATCEILETTWKDIVRVPPQSRVQVIMDFEDYLGRYPQHCHILDHEDHEMMRQFQTINDSANCSNNGVCEVGEDCQSCADCGYPADQQAQPVSGALCGNGLCEAGDGENCITCPDDCAGKQKGSMSRQFCCGAPGGNNNIGCGDDVNDDRCIDSGAELFCRVAPRVSACCGDMLCEGAETEIDCALDCAAEPPQPPVCTYADPTVDIISPNAQDITVDGGSVDYTVSITNNDTAACADTIFDLTASDTNGVNFVIPSNLGQNSVPLAPGANTDVTLTVTGQTGAPNGATNDTSVMAADPAANHGDVTSNTVSTTINVGGQVDCSTFTTKQSCNAEPTCVWVNRNKVCVPNN